MEENTFKKIAKNVLGGALVFAGISHLTFARKAFRAQVPDWVPLEKDDTVVLSGIAEIALGSALVLTDEEHQELVGKIAAAFFVAVFPAFGLDTDEKRLARYFFSRRWCIGRSRAPSKAERNPHRSPRPGQAAPSK